MYLVAMNFIYGVLLVLRLGNTHFSMSMLGYGVWGWFWWGLDAFPAAEQPRSPV